MPRPSLPDGLYVSVSQVKTYLRCPRQFELKYVRAVPPAFLPIALAFGTAFHSALAAYYDELRVSGEPLRPELMVDVFRAAWAEKTDGPVPLQPTEEKSPADAPETLAVRMLHAFYDEASQHAHEVQVEAVEHSFSVPIHDPASGEPLEERLVGTIDLVLLEPKGRVIVEHKSAARRWADEALRFDLQSTAYRYAARQSGLGETALRYQIVTKTRIPVVQLADVTRGPQDEDDFLRTIASVLRAIDAGAFHPVRSWACRSCPYEHACGTMALAT